MDKQWLVNMTQEKQVAALMRTNQKTESFGLTLSEEDAKLLSREKSETLQFERRIEFGEPVIPRIIEEFCDSQYITQNNYLDTLVRLQQIFFFYKGEMEDEITDEELLHFMKEQFEGVCYGDLDYLEGTCLDVFAEAIRAGYRGFEGSSGRGEFGKMDIVMRWDRSIFDTVIATLVD